MWRPVLHVVEDAPRHHLLGEADDVRLDSEMLVAPHLPRCPPACLHLVHHQGDVVPLADVRQSAEECRGAVVISTLGLDRFRDDPGHRLTIRTGLG